MSKLVVICGLSFAGKTFLGRALVQRFDYKPVDVDVTKEQLYGKGLKDDDLTHEQWVKIYDETDKQIERYLLEGKSVVDDSRNFRKSERLHAKEIAEKCGSGFVIIYVNTPENVVRQRLLANRKNQTRHDVEDKDFEEILNIFEKPTADENPIVLNYGEHVDTWIANHTSEVTEVS